MKKFLLTISFAFAFCSLIMAQGVNISGSVLDANGSGIANYSVLIMSDSSSGTMTVINATTNSTGGYSVNAPTLGMTQGDFYVMVQDSCTGSYATQTLSFSPANMTFTNVDFSICGAAPSCTTSFTQSVSGSTASFTSNLTGTAPFTYAWSFGDGTNSSSANPSHTYSTAGSYTVSLATMDGTGCANTYTSVVTVAGSATCSANANISVTGNTATFTAAPTGVAPFTYAWSNGSSAASVVNTYPAVTYNVWDTLCVTITDATGCTSTSCAVAFIPASTPPATSGQITVYMSGDTMMPATGVVYLITLDSNGVLTAIASDTTMQGAAYFTNVPFGDYLIKGALLPSDPGYANYLPTYYTQSLYWNAATTVTLSATAATKYLGLELIAGNNTAGGPGFVGGAVTQGANGPGDPLAGVLVILFDENMNPIGYTYSDEYGNYDFGNLPYGVYYIYVEELGLQTAAIEVTLSAATPTMDEVNFEVGSAYVMFTGTNDVLSVSDLNVFPNPVKDQLYMQFELDKVLDVEIVVTNVAGQVMYNQQKTLNSGNNQVAIDANDFPTGVYFLYLNSESGVVTQKFIKQ